MAPIAASGLSTRHPVDLIDEMFRREPLFAATGLFMAALMLPTLVALAFEARTLADVNVWLKPLKFQASLSIYMLTLAWFAGWLPKGTLQARWYRIFSHVVAVAVLFEILVICYAAALGVPSHFNNSSLLWKVLYPLMGIGAVTLTSASLVYGIAIHRRGGETLSPAFKTAVVSGLVLTFVLTLLVTGFMNSTGSHLVGGNLSDAEAAPLFGWARDGGDFRVPHLFATHAMHVIPVFGLLSTLVIGRESRWPVHLFSAAFVAFVAFTFVQALMGLPFLPMIGAS